MKIRLHYVKKNHPDRAKIKNALEKTEKLFAENKTDAGIDCVLQLGVQIENTLFALYLARKHFEKLNKPDEILLFQDLFNSRSQNPFPKLFIQEEPNE